MDGEEFDTDLFIDKIEKRPSIWDMTSNQYSNKFSKRNAWEEVVLMFCDPSDTKERKKCHGVTLQKKWKNLRDNYIMEAKKSKIVKSGLGTSKNSTCIHFERLRFLQNSKKVNITESSFCINDENPKRALHINDENKTFKTSNKRQHTSKKKLKLNPADEYFANILERSLAQKQVPEKQEEYEDKLFCLSVWKEIKKVPESKRLKLKIDMYNLMLQNQTIQSPSTYHSNHQYNIGYPTYGYTTSSYDIRIQGSHHEHRAHFTGSSNDRNLLTTTSSPSLSPTPSNVSEVSQQSMIDLFEENYN